MKSRFNGIGRLIIVSFIGFIFPTVVLHNQTSPTDQYMDAVPRDKNDNARTTPKSKTTLVHFDPYFMGGFRNQHMRFVALVAFALKHNISQILLPSLRWIDPYNKPKSIHHELLFDVEYWNSRADSLGLPLLVNYDPTVLEGKIPSGSNESSTVIPCWNVDSSLYFGLNERILRSSKTNIRRTNIWKDIGQEEPYTHCRRTPGDDGANNPDKIKEAARQDPNTTSKVYRFTHLIPHGGLSSSGRLWWEYNSLQDGRHKSSEPVLIDGQLVHIHPEHVYVEKSVYELLRPSKVLREATEDAIDRAMQNTTTHHAGETNNRSPRLLALHPRVEQEMLTHRCSKYMETNLTKVFERLQTFPALHDANSSSAYRFDLVFIAVSKDEIEKNTHLKGNLGSVMNQNRDALYRARSHGLFGSSSGNNSSKIGIPIFESGTDSAAKVQFPRIQSSSSVADNSTFDTAQSLGVIELVASIINFFTLVNADIFVGVKGSTYSTDAFSVRYYQHKEEGGGENYIVGPDGIQRLYGPAPPHACV
ncbi:hypothetical protein ACHAXR_005457 [Thalassiosira sp. AJA248-18]